MLLELLPFGGFFTHFDLAGFNQCLYKLAELAE
jgi:hypothetical protein